MADEITLSISLAYEKGNVEEITRTLSNLGIDVSGSRLIHNIQNIGTSEEALALSEVSPAGGLMWIKNLDNTNYVELRLPGTGSSNDSVKLLAGEAYVFRLGSDVSAPYAIANSAACYVEYIIWEA